MIEAARATPAVAGQVGQAARQKASMDCAVAHMLVAFVEMKEKAPGLQAAVEMDTLH